MILLNLLLSSVLIGGVYALFASGLSLLLGSMRVFNIAHGAALTASALITIKIARDTGLGLFPLVILGGVIGALLGIPLEFVAIRPFRKARVLAEDMHYGTMIATLALLFVANDLTAHFTHAEIWSYPQGTYSSGVIQIGEIALGTIYVIDFAVAIVLIVLVAALLRFSQAGRAIRGIADDHRAAALLGINVNRYSLVTAMLSSMLAGVAGVLLAAAFAAVTFTFGDDILFKGFVIVILGGIGSVMGTLGAAFVLALIEGFVAYQVGGSWSQAVALSVLIVLLIFRPQGLFGRPELVRA